MNGDVFHTSKLLNVEIIGRIESLQCVAERRDRLSIEERTPRGVRHMTVNPIQAAKSGTYAPLPPEVPVFSRPEKQYS